MRDYLASKSGRNVVINILPAIRTAACRRSSWPRFTRLREGYPAINIILLDHRNEIRLSLPQKVSVNPFKTLHHCMALIAQADLVISPDTSVVHMAAAWKKPLVAVYKDVRMNNRLWAPGYDRARQIIVKCGKVHQLESLPDLIMAEIDPGTLQQTRAG